MISCLRTLEGGASMLTLRRWLWRWMVFSSVLVGCVQSGKNDSSAVRVYQWWRRSLSFPAIRWRIPVSAELTMTSPQIIEHRGYSVEIHPVTTDDGYILGVHRITPKASNRKAVFLQHGVFNSDEDFVLNPSSSSLAFRLADLGYDVWLGNTRGNTYSRAHVSLSPDELPYWNFAWDEMGDYDLPAVINYILTKTGQAKINYIGHSLGCGTFFIAMIKHPELNSKIEVMVALAPAAAMAHLANYLRFLTPFTNQIGTILKAIGVKDFIDQSGLMRLFESLFCERNYLQARICLTLLMSLTGANPHNVNLTQLPVISAHFPSGTSVNTILQFGQNHNAGEVFNAFDYGAQENLARYGTTTPLSYDLSKVTAPVYIFWGANDRVVSPKDVAWLATKLGNLKGNVKVSDPKFNHVDFLWGINVNAVLYDQVIALLPSP